LALPIGHKQDTGTLYPAHLHSVVDCPAAAAPVPVPRTRSLRPFPPIFPISVLSRLSHPPPSQSFVFLIYPLPPILSFPIHSFFPSLPRLRQTLPNSPFSISN